MSQSEPKIMALTANTVSQAITDQAAKFVSAFQQYQMDKSKSEALSSNGPSLNLTYTVTGTAVGTGNANNTPWWNGNGYIGDPPYNPYGDPIPTTPTPALPQEPIFIPTIFPAPGTNWPTVNIPQPKPATEKHVHIHIELTREQIEAAAEKVLKRKATEEEIQKIIKQLEIEAAESIEEREV